MKLRTLLATLSAGFTLVSIGLAVAAAIALGHPFDITWFPAVAAFAIVGWLLTARLPGNIVGPLLLMTSLGFSFLPWGDISAWMDLHGIAGAATIAGLSNAGFVLDVGGLVLLLPLFFPDGRLPSSRRMWRVIVACDITYMVFATLNVIVPGPVDLADGVRVDNPLAVPSLKPLTNAVLAGTAPLFLIGVVGSVSAVIIRWRQANAERRAQLKWVFPALLVIPIPFALHDVAEGLSNLLLAFLLPLVPICLAIAVLRYRLYDIDRILSRTVSYLLITAAIIGLYVGLVALTEDVLDFSSSLAVAATTLIAAAAFQPLRHRVQRSVDRRFDRAAYDARRTVDVFSARLRNEVDPDAIRADLISVVAGAVNPSSAWLWVAPPLSG